MFKGTILIIIMENLEFYLDNCNENVDHSIFNSHHLFGYTNKEEYLIDLNFMLKNLYKLNIIHSAKIRLEQSDFRSLLIYKYNKCIVTSETCITALEACHIIPVAHDGSYNINNGLLLSADIHKTFDAYYWSINPNTLKIETSNIDIGRIKNYTNHKVDLSINDTLYHNLSHHYNYFIEKMK